MLDLKKLQTFKVTVDKGSFSAAAEKLNYSPSTVSKHIAELKEEIGEPLIKEDTLSKGLTEVGMLTYNYAVETTTKFNNFKLNISESSKRKTIIRIAGIERYLSEMVLAKVISYQHQHKHLQFDLIAKTSDETLKLLKNSDLEFGIVADLFIPPSFEGVTVKHENLTLIASEKTMEKVKRENIDLNGLPILIDKKATTIFKHVLENNNQFSNIIHLEGDDIVVEGVRSNFCLGVTSDGCFSSKEFHVLKVFSDKAPIRLVYSSDIYKDKVKKQFLESLIRHIEQLNL